MILVPSRAPDWLEKHPEWVTALEAPPDGRLRINAQAVVKLGRARTQAYWGPRLVSMLTQHLPIYYRSWAELVHVFSVTVRNLPNDPHREHWARVGRELEKLARRAAQYA